MQKLNKQQMVQWETDGFLILEQVLDQEEVAFLCSEIDRLRHIPGFEPVGDKNLPIGHYGWLPHAESRNNDGWMDRRDLLTYGKHFVDLMDRKGVFELIVDIMGPYICLSMTQAIVRPHSDTFGGYTHTDGGEALRCIRPSESSNPLAVKAMYVLTDVDEPDSGNLTVFPGSHRKQIPFETDNPITPNSPGSKQLMARAGDCILFPHSMWHGPCVNRSGRARKTILYNYCQLFMRQYDYEFTPAIAQWCSPRQKRLLGDLGYDFRPGSYFYCPRDQIEIINELPDQN